MKFIVDEPNFSVIMPGGCNAKCPFCFYKHRPETELEEKMWLIRLSKIINNLPSNFNEVSITGGEPTINPGLLYRACIILKQRFDKVVITSNGTNLQALSNLVSWDHVDYANVSRHSFNIADNTQIFNTKTATTEGLINFIEFSHMYGKPVTINCVVTDDCTGEFINTMIDYCNVTLQAYAVKFRTQCQGPDLDTHNITKILEDHMSIYKDKTGDI